MKLGLFPQDVIAEFFGYESEDCFWEDWRSLSLEEKDEIVDIIEAGIGA